MRTSLVLALLAAFAATAQEEGRITFDRILKGAEGEPGNWLTYSGNYAGHRYSPLSPINETNVARLRPAWSYQVNSLQRFETTPIVDNGIMYISEPPSNVTAIDIRTGRPLWRYRRVLGDGIRVCCGQVNRGVAVLGGLVYVGTVDAHLVALDVRTGAVRWDVTVADYTKGYSITAAPLAVKDKIIMGMAGGEYGVRGFLDAYDAKTGKRVWRFHTVPGSSSEPEAKTWAGESWKNGAAATWVTGSYDPETNLLLWGTGNPGPDWNGDVRLGDNLYSDSLIAIDADTGTLKWYFQFTPHDVHDWDATAVPVLVDTEFRGEKRKLVLFANRNGFYYVIDRVTGKFLLGKPYVKQTWATGLDDNGRPIRVPGTSPTLAGVKVWPSVAGASNWFSPSYSPKTNLLYVSTRESGSTYFTGDAQFTPGEQFNGGGFRNIPGEEEYGAIRAFAPSTGALVWEHRVQAPPWAGLLSTAGNLVFGATAEGQTFALHAATGKPLWRYQTGGQGRSNPMSYSFEGKQYVAVAIGSALHVFGLD